MKIPLVAAFAVLSMVGVSGAASRDTANPSDVVSDFQGRLLSGDTQGAMQLLDPTLLVYEGGVVEASRDEYVAHHLGADAEFLKGATVRQLSRREGGHGDVAWVATESEISTAGEKPATYVSTETMLLTKTAKGWRISHIHWSSRVRRAK